MNSFISMSDIGFAILFSAIMLTAAIPTARAFLRKAQRCGADYLLKLEMLKSGASADEIIHSLCREVPTNR